MVYKQLTAYLESIICFLNINYLSEHTISQKSVLKVMTDILGTVDQ
jgi:hypothetical protein